VDEPYRVAIVGPNGKKAMQEYARALKARDDVELVVDPGQGLGQFDRDELRELVDGASIYVVNDYEWSLTRERSGWSADEIAGRVGAVVVTRGPEGSWIRRGAERVEVPAVPAETVVDPTGCGDAYRAGLLHGRAQGLDLETSCRMGSVLGALKVAVEGPQGLSHDAPAFEQLRERFAGELAATRG